MSLINDALKKAQSQRAASPIPGPTPAPAPGPASIPTVPRKGKNPLSKTILIGATASLLCALLSVAVTLYILKEDPVPAMPVVTSPPADRAAALAPSATPPAVAATTPAAPIASTPATPPRTEPTTPAPSPSLAIPVVTAPPPPVAPAAASASLKQTARIQAFISRLRVNSIRISENGNKAIINERLFRANDIIEPTLGLKLVGIETNQLTFVDEGGNPYFRHF